MNAASQTKMDREQIYSILRREIVSGSIAHDQELFTADLDVRFSCAGKITSEVLAALASDGYVRRTKRGYIPDEWPTEEICDLFKHLMLLHEIASMRLVEDRPHKLNELMQHRSDFQAATSSDERFIAIVEWLRSLMTAGSRSTVAEFASTLAPAAILRIMWAVIETSTEVVQAMVGVEEQLRTNEPLAVRDAVSRFWAIVLQRSEASAAGPMRDLGAGGEFRAQDPTLSGVKPVFGRSDRWSFDILPRARDTPRSAPRLPV